MKKKKKKGSTKILNQFERANAIARLESLEGEVQVLQTNVDGGNVTINDIKDALVDILNIIKEIRVNCLGDSTK